MTVREERPENRLRTVERYIRGSEER